MYPPKPNDQPEDYRAAAEWARDDDRMSLFVTYCEHSAKGLRKPALQVIREFTDQVNQWRTEDRRSVVIHLLDTNLSMPHPWTAGVAIPTLRDWCDEDPPTAVPFRYLGMIGGHEFETYVERAIEKDPNDQPALRCLLDRINRSLNFGFHEMPSAYLGDIDEDTELMDRAEQLIPSLAIDLERQNFASNFAEHRRLLMTYQEFLAEGSPDSFRDWCERNGRNGRHGH